MSTTTSDPLIGRLIDGRYEVRSRVARGGMATVYEAHDSRLDRTVALKVMHPHLAESSDFVARFRREARAAARLNHSGIVALYDQGHAAELSYLTMEFISGTNVRELLRRTGPPTVSESLNIVEQVLAALGCAHRAGLVHRDMKPENVLVQDDGAVKVTDFGLARAVTEATAASTGTVLGTVAYLAPEIVTTGLADARADVYAVGVMLYELLTGHQPFAGDVPIRVAFQHVNDGVPAPSDRIAWLPAEIDELVAAFTARDPEERPATADAAAALLQRTRDVLSPDVLERSAPAVVGPVSEDATGHTAATPLEAPQDGFTEVHRLDGTVSLPIGAIPTTAPAPPRKRRKRPVVLTLLVVLLLAAGGSAWWFLQGPGAYIEVPAVAGLSEDAAVAALRDVGLSAAVEREHHDTAAEGEVFDATPAPGEAVRRDGTVTLVVSRGILMVEIPELVGRDQQEAEAALAAAGLPLGEITTPWDAEVPQGEVMAVSPGEGERIAHNQPVDLVVSAGREPVAVVSVVGAEESRAIAELEAVGLRAAATEEYSPDVPTGHVIRQDPSPGDDTQLYRNDEVTIVVSLGPEPVELPNLVGRQLTEARQVLEDAGFLVEVHEPLGGIFGTVHGMSPRAGELAVPGSVITLTVV